MKTREAVIQDAKELLEIITTYKVLRPEQLTAVMKNKSQSAQQTVIRLLEREDRIFIRNDIVSTEENWSKNFDRGLIAAFWVLLDFWEEVLYHTTAGFPAKIEFITADNAYDIIIVEDGQTKILNTFYSKYPSTVQHLVVVKNEEQMYEVSFPGIAAFCMVGDDGTISYYQESEAGQCV